jgi:hypothetical protein
MLKTLLRNNITMFSILLFLFLYIIIIWVINPNFIYNKDGSLRTFGLGFSKKTVFPAWFLAIFLSIMSYFIIFYYVSAFRV